LFTAAGTAWFDGNLAREIDSGAHVTWNPTWVTADLLLPVIDLGHDDVWYFEGPSRWVAIALTIVGWTLSAAALACLPRMLRRR
jgi:hypothetical protein